MKRVENEKIMALCEGAVAVALAWALSYLKVDLWFQGGSVDLVMIPLIIFSLRRGGVWGIMAGLVLGTVKYFLPGGFAVSWQSMLLDYPIAYAAVGCAGFFRGAKRPWLLGSIAAGVARFAVHFISGVTIYAQWMPETFMDMTMVSVPVYSALYNGGFMLPNTMIAVIVTGVMYRALPIRRFIDRRA